jgi:DNA polymerase-3 subunit gamma/tau
VTTNLANQWRPHTLADTVGQGHVKTVLQAMIRKGTMPPVLVFSGSRGVGKTTTARTVAAALNCPEGANTGDCCTNCGACRDIENGRSMCVLEIDAASNGRVEEVRRVQELVLYQAPGLWRVIILDEAHSLSRDASNALLKVLEEPPPLTLFILATTEPNKLLNTILSRSMQFEFRRLSVTHIKDRLRKIAEAEKINAADDMLLEIAYRAQGGMRDAVMMLDQVSRVGVSDVIGLYELLGIRDFAPTLIEQAVQGDLRGVLHTVEESFQHSGDAGGLTADITAIITRTIACKAGGPVNIPNPDTAAKVEALAKKCSIPALVATMKVLWELKLRTRHSDPDQRTAMELAAVLITDSLSGIGKASNQPNPSTTPSGPASMDEMRRALGG